MSDRSKALEHAVEHARSAHSERGTEFDRKISIANAYALIAIADALETMTESLIILAQAQNTVAAKASYRPPFPP